MTRRAWCGARLVLTTAWLLLFSSRASGYKFEFVYTANSLSSNTVSVISTATNRVIATIPVGVDPHGIAATPDGAFVYVSNMGPSGAGPGSVSVIDTATNTVGVTIPIILAGPLDIAIIPDGASAYIAGGGTNNVYVISTATNTVASTIGVAPTGPSGGVAVTPDGAFVWVAGQVNDTVAVIRTATNTLTATIPVGGCPSDIAITPDGAFAYVANPAPANVPHPPPCQIIAGNGSVSVISTATNTVVASVGGLVFSSFLPFVAITPDGAYAYVTSCGLGVCVIDTATKAVSATFKPGLSSMTQGLAFTSDGASVYIGGCGDPSGSNACVVDTATNTTTATINLGATPHNVAVATVQALERFKCYKAKTAAGTAKFQQRMVTLADQFESKNTTVVKPVSICNPVDKDGEGIEDSTAHLACYKIKDVSGQSKLTPRNVTTENQFGTETLTATKADTLCVPSEKDGQPSALNLDHFKCYKARTATGAAKFQQRTVSLTDQFESKNTTALRPVSICNPVDKNGEGIKSSLGHLECYRIKDVKGQPKFSRRDVTAKNQFDTETLTVTKSGMLCVPSLKTDTP